MNFSTDNACILKFLLSTVKDLLLSEADFYFGLFNFIVPVCVCVCVLAHLVNRSEGEITILEARFTFLLCIHLHVRVVSMRFLNFSI